jgi:TonB-linked SusC/RagA family outer membrane protein
MKQMKRWCVVASAFVGWIIAIPTIARAQSATISGRVTTEAGAGIPAASVSIGGSTLGALTTEQGQYSIVVPASRVTGAALVVTARRIGYTAKSVNVVPRVGETTTANFTLSTLPSGLEAVVITALGVERQKSQLGTAQQEISTADLNATRSQNFVDQLSGKVAGMTVTGSGTPGGSTKITIRGSNSINGDNTPLFIIDGVPVSNDNRGGSYNQGSLTSSSSSGIDLGSVINDIDPEDIETISVLKGPNAAALYGSRAANGVIVITTKSGKNTGGKIQTEATSTYSWDNASKFMSWQNQYGQGTAGKFSYVDGRGNGVNDAAAESWGPLMDGRLISQFDSPIVDGVRQPTPWVPHPNNADSFFQTGNTLTNNISITGGTDNARGRLSVGNSQIHGVIPNNSFNNLTSTLNGSFRTGKFTASGSVQYGHNRANNRPPDGYNTSIVQQFLWWGRQVNMESLKNQYYTSNGSLFNWNSTFHNNPYWLQNENPEYDERNRIIGTLNGSYALTDWLSASLRGGQDYYNWDISRDFAQGNIQWSNPTYAGAFSDANQHSMQSNLDLLLNASKAMTSRLTMNGLLGGTLRRTAFGNSNISTPGISVPGIYNVSNAAITPTVQQLSTDQRVNSVYGSAAFTWNEWWTVEGTGRTDWSSTLPAHHNSYFYPGINTSMVLTNALPSLKGRILSYAKLRGGYARVGSDATPYQLQTVFQGSTSKFGSIPLFSLADNLANANLKPELTTSAEVGTELGFYDNRITLDASYYAKDTKNQILSLVIPPTSGYGTQAINAGRISNKGFEATLAVTPVRNARGFDWTSTFNYATNHSRVVTLTPGLSAVTLASQWSATLTAAVGQPYGQIVGYKYLRDSTGNLLTSNGLPVRGPQAVLGNVNPKWVGGWNNSFRYKRLSGGFLLDLHEGGQIFSTTNMMCDQSGQCANTLRGREADWNNPGIVVQGIDRKTGQPNTMNVTAEQYFLSLWLIHEQYTYDDSYIKLREARVGYDLPESLIRRLHAQSATVSLVGRNLFTKSKLPNIDPEFTYGTGNAQGFEYATLPTNRSIGLTLHVTP